LKNIIRDYLARESAALYSLNTHAPGPQVEANPAMNKQLKPAKTFWPFLLSTVMETTPTISWQKDIQAAPMSKNLRRPSFSTAMIPGIVMATLTTPVATVMRKGWVIPADWKKAVP